MGTAERREAPEDGVIARGTALREAEAPEALDRGIPASRRGQADVHDVPAAAAPGRAPRSAGRADAVDGSGARGAEEERPAYRPLWVEEPARRPRLPDPVRTAAVRAVLIIALTLLQAMVAFLCTLAGSWLAFPMVISSVVSTVVATWGVLDVWVTRQVWKQRHGVVSTPSSTARALRRERRRVRRQARATERAQERIRRRGSAGQLSHS
jgi:hypothetical protein